MFKLKFKAEKTVQPKDKDELVEIIKNTIKEKGNACDLNFIDTSRIKNMEDLFRGSEFNGDISKWDVSKVEDMGSMFEESQFNGDISKWNVSNVEGMRDLFRGSEFNGDISKWNVSNVKDMSWMFQNSEFNGDISKWNVSKVRDMFEMFSHSEFNGDISKWNVSKVRDMTSMFEDSKFNGDISKWKISPECELDDIFKGCPLAKKYGNSGEKLFSTDKFSKVLEYVKQFCEKNYNPSLPKGWDYVEYGGIEYSYQSKDTIFVNVWFYCRKYDGCSLMFGIKPDENTVTVTSYEGWVGAFGDDDKKLSEYKKPINLDSYESMEKDLLEYFNEAVKMF